MRLNRVMGGIVLALVIGSLALSGACSGSSGSTRVVVAPLSIVTTNLTLAQVGSFYFELVEADGGTAPRTWTLEPTSSLPPGITFDAQGALSGIPTTIGLYPFDLRVTDSGVTQASLVRSFSLDVIAPPALAITSTSPLPNGQEAAQYSQTIQTAGGAGNLSFNVTLGSLPAGVTLDASTGSMFGIPQVAGLYNFTVEVFDSQLPTPNSDAKNFDLTIDPGIPAAHLLINEFNTGGGDFAEFLNPLTVDQDMTGWSFDLWWEGFFVDRYSFPSFVLPAGEVVGVIEGFGTDMTAGPLYVVYAGFNFPPVFGAEVEVILFDDSGSGVDYVAINDHGTATHIPPNLNWTGVFNQDFDFAKAVFNEIVARLSFVDTDAATDFVSLFGTGTAGDLNPGQGPESIILISIVFWDGFTALPYYQKLATLGGLPPYVYSAVDPALLPPGLFVDPIDGAITGMPTTPGTYTFQITTTDSFSPPSSDTQQIMINIISATPGSPSDIKINEVDPGITGSDPDWFEIVNSGPGAVDISGWHAQVIYDASGSGIIVHITFPRGVVLPAGQIFYVEEGIGGFSSQFEMGSGFTWSWSTPNPGACALVDQNFQHIDYMNWNNPVFPHMPAGTTWSGSISAAATNNVMARRISRTFSELDDDTDWCVLTPGTGTPRLDNSSNCP